MTWPDYTVEEQMDMKNKYSPPPPKGAVDSKKNQGTRITSDSCRHICHCALCCFQMLVQKRSVKEKPILAQITSPEMNSQGSTIHRKILLRDRELKDNIMAVQRRIPRYVKYFFSSLIIEFYMHIFVYFLLVMYIYLRIGSGCKEG